VSLVLRVTIKSWIINRQLHFEVELKLFTVVFILLIVFKSGFAADEDSLLDISNQVAFLIS